MDEHPDRGCEAARLRVRNGWTFRLDVPLDNIASATLISEKPLAWGVHPAIDGWLVNGSRNGIVKIEFIRPVEPERRPLGLSGLYETRAARALYISLTEPDAVAAAVRSTPASDHLRVEP